MTIQTLEEQGINWGGYIYVTTWDGDEEREFGKFECYTDGIESATDGACSDEPWYCEMDVTNIYQYSDGLCIEVTEY